MSLFECEARGKVAKIIVTCAYVCLLTASISFAEAADRGGVFYSTHVASFKNVTGAKKTIDTLKKMGLDGFFRKVDIPGKGVWYRVYEGKYETRAAALGASRNLVAKGLIVEAAVHKLGSPRRGVAKAVSMPVAPVKKNRESSPVPSDESTVQSTMKNEVSRPVLRTAEVVREGKGPVVRKKIGALEECFQKALIDFEKGDYENAIEVLNRLCEVKDMSGERREMVLRRIADCHFFLGMKGAKKEFMKAIDAYRLVLRDYPTATAKNVLAQYRLAKSYVNTSFYHEAFVKFNAVYKQHPGNKYAAESLFGMGRMSYMTKRHEDAIDYLTRYIRKYSDGDHVKASYFIIGDCYAQLGDFDKADSWYKRALEKFPNLEDIPRDILLKAGSHCYSTGEYERALNMFFAYVNVYPQDTVCKEILCEISRCLITTDRESDALKILSRIMERYPGSNEARESALVMAEIGIKSPGITVPLHIMDGMENYLNPLETYESMARCSDYLTRREKVMFSRADALFENGKFEKALKAYCDYLEAFPNGKFSDMSKVKMVACLHEKFKNPGFQKRDTDVVNLYYQTRGKGLITHGDFKLLFAVGNSLRRIGLVNESCAIFDELMRRELEKGDMDSVRVALARNRFSLGDCKGARNLLEPLLERNISSSAPLFSPAVHELMGDILFRGKDYGDAVKEYSHALRSTEIEEVGSNLYRKFADSLSEVGHSPTALVNYRKALSKLEENGKASSEGGLAETYEGLGSCLMKFGEYKQAITMFEKALAHTKQDERKTWVLLKVMRGYVKLGDKVSAEKTLSVIKETNDGEFWDGMTNFYLDETRWSDKYKSYTTRG